MRTRVRLKIGQEKHFALALRRYRMASNLPSACQLRYSVKNIYKQVCIIGLKGEIWLSSTDYFKCICSFCGRLETILTAVLRKPDLGCMQHSWRMPKKPTHRRYFLELKELNLFWRNWRLLSTWRSIEPYEADTVKKLKMILSYSLRQNDAAAQKIQLLAKQASCILFTRILPEHDIIVSFIFGSTCFISNKSVNMHINANFKRLILFLYFHFKRA